MSFFAGIAVGDITTLMKQALVTRNDILFELLADCELLKLKVKKIYYRIKLIERADYVRSFYPALKSNAGVTSCIHPEYINKVMKPVTEKMWDANEIDIDQLEQQMDFHHELLKKIYRIVSNASNATPDRDALQESTQERI